MIKQAKTMRNVSINTFPKMFWPSVYVSNFYLKMYIVRQLRSGLSYNITSSHDCMSYLELTIQLSKYE